MRRWAGWLAAWALAPVLVGRSVRAEDGILVLQVSDTHDRPVVGVVLGTRGDGSVGAPTDVAGKTRLRLAAQTKPGQWVSLLVVHQPAGEEWVPISPWNSRVRVPPFENDSENFQDIVVVRRGDRELLESGLAVGAAAHSVVATVSQESGDKGYTEAQREQVVRDEAVRFGVRPGDLDKAIRAWGAKASDSYDKGVAALYAKHYPEAADQLEQSLRVREAALHEAQAGVIDAASLLGQARQAEGRHLEAVDAYAKAVSIDPQSVQNLNGLGEAQLDAGRVVEARATIERALELAGQMPGPDRSAVGVALSNLAGVCQAEGDDATAARLLAEAGELYRQQARFTRAEALLLRALAIDEKIRLPDDPWLAADLNSLGLTYKAQARYSKAKPILTRALRIQKRAFGLNHPEYALCLRNVAILKDTLGNHAKAARLLERALKIDTMALGPDAPAVASDANGLAETYEALKLYDKEKPLLEQALAIDQRVLGPRHPHVAVRLANIAGFYTEQGRYAEAKPFLERAIRIDKRALSSDHPHVAIALNNLADIYRALGQSLNDETLLSKAETLLKRALRIAKRVLGPEHPQVAMFLDNYFALLRAMGRPEEAGRMLARASRIRAKHAPR